MEKMMTFGPEGWGGRFASKVTFNRVRRYIFGYIHYLNHTLPPEGEIKVILSFDSNIISRKFAREASRILTNRRIRVIMPDRDLPLSAVSLYIARHGLTGGLDFRKACQRLNYYQLRILDTTGQLAMPSQTCAIEWEIKEIESSPADFEYTDLAFLQPVDLIDEYLDFLMKKVDRDLLRKASGQFIIDNMFGSSRDILERVFLRTGVDFFSLHNFDDPSWGGIVPVIRRQNLSELKKEILNHRKLFGIAVDKDCFEIAALDSNGKMIDSRKLQLALMEYLISRRKFSGGIVKSLDSSHSVDMLAEYYGLPVTEVFEGTKYLSCQLSHSEAFAAVDKSRGMIFNSHCRVPDGILYTLYVIEMFAAFDFRVENLIDSEKYPAMYRKEYRMAMTPARRKRYRSLLRKGSPVCPANYTLRSIRRLDGIKCLFSDSSLVIREEPGAEKLQVIARAKQAGKTGELIDYVKDIFK